MKERGREGEREGGREGGREKESGRVKERGRERESGCGCVYCRNGRHRGTCGRIFSTKIKMKNFTSDRIGLHLTKRCCWAKTV